MDRFVKQFRSGTVIELEAKINRYAGSEGLLIVEVSFAVDDISERYRYRAMVIFERIKG